MHPALQYKLQRLVGSPSSSVHFARKCEEMIRGDGIGEEEEEEEEGENDEDEDEGGRCAIPPP